VFKKTADIADTNPQPIEINV